MKKILIATFLTFFQLHQSYYSNAQSTTPGNASFAFAEWLGWNAGVPKHLDIANGHPGIWDLNLYTNAGAGPVWANMRQKIMGQYNGQNGLIGIGDLGTSVVPTFLPWSMLHSYRNQNQPCYHQFSIDYSNGNAPPTSWNQGFAVGVEAHNPIFFDMYGPTPPYSLAALKQYEEAPMDFYLNNKDDSIPMPLRMRITYGVGSSHLDQSYLDPVKWATGVTKVTLSHMGNVPSADLRAFYQFDHPVAMLNIGENQFILPSPQDPYSGGARVWMDVGTFYCFDSDNMYTGLKENGRNQKDAVINWGDDPTTASPAPNHLFFNFTSAGGTSQADHIEGLEVARMLAVGGDYGRMGIGGDPNLAVTNFYHPQSASTIEPGNTLEVNSPDIDETITSGGNSGLRFSDLNTNSTTTANPGMGILSVNQDGDVIYVPEIGNYCGDPVVRPLTAHYELPLDRFDYHFTGQSFGTTDVLVGSACTNPNPSAKFQSYQNINHSPTFVKSYAGLFSNATDDKVAIGIESSSLLSTMVNFGVAGLVQQYQGLSNIGVLGSTNGYAGLLAGNLNVGVYGFTQFNPIPTPVFPDYAVVGDLGILCLPCLPNVAVTNPSAAGYFNGDVMFTTASYWVSDSAVKENVQDIIDPMTILNQLNPKSYTFKRQQKESMQLSHGSHFGLLAQDVEAILPQLVKYGVHPARFDDQGNQTYAATEFKALNYTEFIPFLIAALKEQQQKLDALQAQIDNCCSTGNRNANPQQGDGNG